MSSENSLKSIAQRTGVSISTVSRVLNGKHEQYRISPRTVKRVLDEAKRIDYKPSLVAQSLRTRKSYTIGLLIPSIDNPYFAHIASEIVLEARRYNYTIILLDSLEDEKTEKECIETLLARNIDGIILVPCGERPDYLEKIDKRSPVVLIDRYFESTSLSYICTDNYQGAMEGMKLLLGNGHRDILCIRGIPHSSPSKERVKGYMDAMNEASCSHLCHITGNDYSINNGYLETKLAIGSSSRPTAIFTLSNTIMLGAIKAIGESSLRIPEDISILSYDNNLFLDFMHPSITRISQPTKEISQLAVKVLMERMSNPDMPPKQIKMPAQIIEGHSIKKLL